MGFPPRNIEGGPVGSCATRAVTGAVAGAIAVAGFVRVSAGAGETAVTTTGFVCVGETGTGAGLPAARAGAVDGFAGSVAVLAGFVVRAVSGMLCRPFSGLEPAQRANASGFSILAFNRRFHHRCRD